MSDVCGFYSRGSDRHFSLSWEMVLGVRKATLLNYIAHNVGENRRQRREKYFKDDHYWWHHSLKQFYLAFPAWSERKIQYLLKELRDEGLIQSREVQGNAAMWHTIVGSAIDALEAKGQGLLDARIEEIAGAGTAEIATPESQKVRLQPPSGVAESADIKNYTTREKKKNDAPVADAPVAASGTAKLLEDLQGRAAEKSLLKFRASFARNQSVLAVERLWEAMVVSYHGRHAYIPMSAADRANTKRDFIQFCAGGGTTILDLLEFCVANWDDLRMHKLKALKITSPYPSFRTIYAFKDRFLEQMKHHARKEKTASKAREISEVGQIPKDHPNYKVLHRIVSQGGVVTLS